MTKQNPIELLNEESRLLLINEAVSKKTIDDEFSSTVTPFNLQEGNEAAAEGDTDAMKSEIAKVLDRLDGVIEKVLKNREDAEEAAAKWVTIVGVVIVLLIAAATVSPLIMPQGGNQILPSIFSSLSVAGLLYLLYSPVQRRLQIADDRSNLVLMAATFRLRFVTAQTPQQLSELGQELSEALRMERDDQKPP